MGTQNNTSEQGTQFRKHKYKYLPIIRCNYTRHNKEHLKAQRHFMAQSMNVVTQITHIHEPWALQC